MNMELTDETNRELYHLPFRIVEESLFYDIVDVESNIVFFSPLLRGVDFSVVFLMSVEVRNQVTGDADVIDVPIEYKHGIMSDVLHISRDVLISSEVAAMDGQITEYIKVQLKSLRRPTRHIEQVTFRRFEKL